MDGDSKYRAPSKFHWVLNTNISHWELRNKQRDYRSNLVNILQRSALLMKNNIKHFQKLDYRGANLQEFTANLEIGLERKFLHIDGYMSFDGYTQLDFKSITSLFNEALQGISSGVYLKVKYIHDNVRVVTEYTAKDNMRLV